ncbi:hypothetical protein GCM10010170_053670 [Dactylosporangium salmoneum]|uniref:Uncharacterized protein n=1 Tax=Dactylosporangium salmoneum TaxID=53361 RepID=A0ABP5TUI5_9ACTN
MLSDAVHGGQPTGSARQATPPTLAPDRFLLSQEHAMFPLLTIDIARAIEAERLRRAGRDPRPRERATTAPTH